MKTCIARLLFLMAALAATGACAADGTLRLATTTSTENSGLLKIIIPKFEAASGL